MSQLYETKVVKEEKKKDKKIILWEVNSDVTSQDQKDTNPVIDIPVL